MTILVLALTAGAADSEVLRSGAARERVARDDADLVIFYTSEHRGKLGTCGCDANPRGGLPRLGGWLETVRRVGPGTPEVRVHAGWWASDRIATSFDLVPEAIRDGNRVAEALELLEFDAINLTFRDGPLLRTEPLPAAAVSANAGPGAPLIRRIEAGPWRVAVTGVGRAGSPELQPAGWTFADPVAAVAALAPGIAPEEVFVVLAYDTGRDTARLAAIPGVDVVILAGGFAGKVPAEREGGGAVWARTRDEGLAVGELRLWLGEGGAVERYVDRWVDLDAWIPERADLRRLERRAAREPGG